MHTKAVVEISAEMDPQALARLVSAAYRWSRSGLVVLALRGVSPAAVDRLLNPVVAEVGLDVFGIVYVNAADTAEVMRYVSPSTLVVSSIDGFRSRATASEVAALTEEETPAHPQIPGVPSPTTGPSLDWRLLRPLARPQASATGG